VFDRGELGVRRRDIVGGGTAGEDDPRGEGTASEVGDVTDATVGKKNAQDPQAGCVMTA
jgi:hypothetical protein